MYANIKFSDQRQVVVRKRLDLIQVLKSICKINRYIIQVLVPACGGLLTENI